MKEWVDQAWTGLLQLPEQLQILVIFIGSYVSEDVTTIGSSLMYHSGKLSWYICFFGCLGGIWFGDLVNYTLGRFIGRPLLKLPGLRKLAASGKIKEYETAFHEGHTAILFMGRFLPSARFPVQFCAGLVHLNFRRFLYVTTLASIAWTPFLIGLTLLVGPSLLNALRPLSDNPLIAVGLSICLLYLMVDLISQLSNPYWKMELGSRLLRLTRWEFWPPVVFYLPIAFHYLYHSLRTLRPTLPTLANPGMDYGGFLGESKSSIMAAFQGERDFIARTQLLPADKDSDARFAAFQEARAAMGLDYPVILKPDVGQRGAGVRVIRDDAQAADYLRACPDALVVQEYAPGPVELGVFYYRMPGEETGRVFSITSKEFPVVVGDGERKLHELIAAHPRARYQAPTFLRRHAQHLRRVLSPGERFTLVESGNHCQGTTFLDGRGLLTDALERRIDEISRSFDGFYFGRYDLRGPDLRAIQEGRDFKIIELNGVTSEATHIYSPEISLMEAYRTLFRQWNLAWEISEKVRVKSGLQPPSFLNMIRVHFHYRAMAGRYPVSS